MLLWPVSSLQFRYMLFHSPLLISWTNEVLCSNFWFFSDWSCYLLSLSLSETPNSKPAFTAIVFFSFFLKSFCYSSVFLLSTGTIAMHFLSLTISCIFYCSSSPPFDQTVVTTQHANIRISIDTVIVTPLLSYFFYFLWFFLFSVKFSLRSFSLLSCHY